MFHNDFAEDFAGLDVLQADIGIDRGLDADVTEKNSKKRVQLSEVGVYTVKNGKIVREEFLPFTGKG